MADDPRCLSARRRDANVPCSVYWRAKAPRVPTAPVSGLFLKLRTEVVPVLATATPFDIAAVSDSRRVAVELPVPLAVKPAVVLKEAMQLMRLSVAAAAFDWTTNPDSEFPAAVLFETVILEKSFATTPLVLCSKSEFVTEA
jgi:hypothetical protein